MELISQKAKKIMEGCKDRAREAGLRFDDNTLEYVVTNRDLIELTPKIMIPTMYDYWVHDVEVLKEKGRYELYPSNPYETVINTRPAISYYNDNNPDWLNCMIFYHVLAHIDFFQNNLFFRQTWDSDFLAQALSDKRMIAKLRAEKGRWADYAIEFSRGLDNLVRFYTELDIADSASQRMEYQRKIDEYFDTFLQKTHIEKKRGRSAQRRLLRRQSFYLSEIDRYNACKKSANGDERLAVDIFFGGLPAKSQNFIYIWETAERERRIAVLKGELPLKKPDPLQYILRHSIFLNKTQNSWMKAIIEVVRKTSLFFQPQIRTKIMNEGWASYWHEKLFLADSRINGNEVNFSRVHAGVTAMPRVGLNPYALGMRLFQHIKEMGDAGKDGFGYEKILGRQEREEFNEPGDGNALIFRARETMNDFLFLSRYINQDFTDRFSLFVAGRRLNEMKRVWEIFVKSRKAKDYRQMVLANLYHPPHVECREDGGVLRLVHHFEGKPLIEKFIGGVLIGAEYFWGAPVELETSSVDSVDPLGNVTGWKRMLYTMGDKKLKKEKLETPTGTDVAE